MNELKTLQEEGEKEFEREWRLLFNSGDDRMKYPTQFRVLRAMIFVNREKVFKLGIMKGVEMVEGVVEKEASAKHDNHEDWQDGDCDCDGVFDYSEIQHIIKKLKQELK